MRQRTLYTAIAVVSASLVAGLAPAAVATPAAAVAPKSKVVSDFNGDGYRDLVINQYGAFTDQKVEGGAVAVLYGSKTGVSAAKRQVITQNTPGVPGTTESFDRFGSQAVAGDYDGDGFTDLAISASGEDITFGTTYRRNAGQTTIVWGGRNGLTKHGAVTVKQTTPTGPDVRRGSSLAAGDFNGDGKTDLATGDYSTGRGGEVLYGPIGRTTGKAKSVINLGLKDGQTFVHTALDTGDVTGDGITDLVIQVYAGRVGPVDRIELHRGTTKGLIRTGNLTGADGKPLVNRSVTDGHVAVGDLDKDGHADIVVGKEWTYEEPIYSGEVSVVYGGKTGQSTRPVQVITQQTEGVPDDSEKNDYFGTSVSVGDINADGYADLAIGASVEDLGDLENTGQVTTLLGAKGGLTGTGAKSYSKGTQGMPGKPSSYDFFGSAVKLADLNGDHRADLVVGSGGDDEPHDGRVDILPAAKDGAITAVGAKEFLAPAIGLTNGTRQGFGQSFGE
ncbi:FG-GAP and VCBS repeat-containing protein [Streptomyces sp. NPDC057638]|uniref:FG-GAP and VCBS repeat-containing protein n=1 Tax=Streptomyces sp. NPDC057638 TaxID=3346190 RepID=UPI003692DCD6